jgi:mlo protein
MQMGSHMKKAIFEEQTAKALKKWQKAAREKRKLSKATGADVSSSGFLSGENTPSHGSSPIHLLHKYKTNSTTHDIESVVSSPRAHHSVTELSETEGPARLSGDDLYEPRRHNNWETNNGEFSFVKP